jgi:hypothetical protein
MIFENECPVEEKNKEQIVESQVESKRKLFVCWREEENNSGEENKELQETGEIQQILEEDKSKDSNLLLKSNI